LTIHSSDCYLAIEKRLWYDCIKAPDYSWCVQQTFATKLYLLFYLLLTSWDTVQLEHEVQHKIIPSDSGKWNVEQTMGCN